MPPIVVCTVGNPGISLLEASARLYAPDCDIFVDYNEPSTFGQAYNSAMQKAFRLHDEIIIANDDVVLTPTTVPVLMEDVRALQRDHGDKVGFVATLSDNVRKQQNIRLVKEGVVRQERVIAPLFAWVSKVAFHAAQFPPLNWYSDDVICEDLNELGFKHFVSRAYIHHAGSQTVGTDYVKLNAAAMPWLTANRPQYIEKWFR